MEPAAVTTIARPARLLGEARLLGRDGFRKGMKDAKKPLQRYGFHRLRDDLTFDTVVYGRPDLRLWLSRPLALHIHLALNLDALCLWAAGAVQ